MTAPIYALMIQRYSSSVKLPLVCPVSHVPDAHLATHLLFCVGGAWAGAQLGFIVVCESVLCAW